MQVLTYCRRCYDTVPIRILWLQNLTRIREHWFHVCVLFMVLLMMGVLLIFENAWHASLFGMAPPR